METEVSEDQIKTTTIQMIDLPETQLDLTEEDLTITISETRLLTEDITDTEEDHLLEETTQDLLIFPKP